MENPANNKKSNVLKGVVVTALGGALILGGAATYAGWSDSATFEDQTVTAGSLQVAAQATQITDTTNGEVDPIDDLSNWTAVPGDSVEIVMPMDVALVGDNLTATLDTSALEAEFVGSSADHVDLGISFTDNSGNVIPANGTGEHEFVFTANSEDSNANQDPTAISAGGDLDGDVELTATVTVEFSPDTPESALQEQTLATIQDATVDLAQQIEGAANDDGGEEEVPEG